MGVERWDVIVIGAGAAGMMCAIEAARRGRRVLVVDHAKAAGEKIRISGGGRCNFTNLLTAPDRFISANPHFCISALARYKPADFIAFIDRHAISWHEKTFGQLFCDGAATQIVALLKSEMSANGAQLRLQCRVRTVSREAEGFRLDGEDGSMACAALVIATGGKSIPKMGASDFGYRIAAQFGLPITPPRPGLAPFTLEGAPLERAGRLAGVSTPVRARCGPTTFEEAMLFTHRGLSGPAMLQLSSYWPEGAEIVIDMAPGVDLFEDLRAARADAPRQSAASVLSARLPRRLAQMIADECGAAASMANLSDEKLRRLAEAVGAWRLRPNGTEGYRTAEVTVGGVDTRALDSRTMQAKSAPGLYFIGEVVDVTGWLGGYNFQWAWASGWCAGQAV